MPYKQTQAFGGNDGNVFSDDLTQICRLTKVIIRHDNDSIIAISCVWDKTDNSEWTGPTHGGTKGGHESSFELNELEHINRIDGYVENYVNGLTFHTSLGKHHEYGKQKGSPFAIVDIHVGGFFGRSGERLDKIGVYTVVECI